MLRSVEIIAEVAGTAQGNVLHNLHWQERIEIDLDCFLCERTSRTTVFEWGATAAVCAPHDAGTSHRTAARLGKLNRDAKAERRTLTAVVDSWWSPFHDDVVGSAAAPLGPQTPIRLTLGYFCRRNHRSGVDVIRPGMAAPATVDCQYCDVTMATLATAPTVRLLS